MPAKRLPMRKITEVLRLKHEGQLSNRAIARAVGTGHSTVGDYLRRAKAAGLSWPLPPEMTNEELEAKLYPEPPPSHAARPLPDWQQVDRELRRKGMTLMLLWQEYKSTRPDGYQYSRFCELFREWESKLDVVMRQRHVFGEKLFVDYAGQTVPVTDPDTGEVSQAQIFVAAFGASNYTYCEATRTQTLPDWTRAHVRAFDYFGGVPQIVVCDNLRSGVVKTCRYEPELNPTYQDLATHYGVAVVPARRRKPRDKAKVEAAVQHVERRILAPLRSRTFFSLAELNAAIRGLLEELNERPFQKLEGSRRSLFEEHEQPALRPLPEHPYVFATWHKRQVGPDYHVEADGHHYSVPHRYARDRVDVRLAETTVEVFRRGQRIASHVRRRSGGHTTLPEHMPPSHRYLAELTPERLLRQARRVGPQTEALIGRVLDSSKHLEQKRRTCRGILRLEKAYGAQRLEAASRRALAIGTTSYKSLASILEHGLDSRPLAETEDTEPIEHDNIRGAIYYFGGQAEC